MNLREIKTAVNEGKTVHWASKGYTVILDNVGQYLIAWNHGGSNANYIGLTHRDGVTLNGEENEFFLGDVDNSN